MTDVRRFTMRALTTLSLALLLIMGGHARAWAQQQFDASTYAGLRWRMIGPFRGGRVNGVTGVPGQPNTFYFGSVGGGVWKSQNSGRTWTPVFDAQSIASIGALAVAPSNPNVVYVGSGEADMRSQISHGNGMYKSTDAGQTWTHVGLDGTRQIGRVLVDPKNANVVFVAALGHAYGANPERGVYRTRDGGATWQQVLFKSNDVGAIDLQFDPTNSQIVYASLWNTRRPPWSIYPPSYGPGGGVFKSTDGGNTWQQLTTGLPVEGLGRIGLAVTPTNRNRVYAIVDAKVGGLYRSDDAGATWSLISDDKRIWGRGWYFCKVAADPKNADTVYVSNTSLYRSTDAGKTWTALKGAPGGDDYHQLWIYPDDPKRMILASDQGTIVTEDGAQTWSSWYNQPTAQLYHVAADNRFPYWVTGAQQDSGAVGVPTRSNHAEISMHDWSPVCAGGESDYTAPDPLHPEILFGGRVTRCNVVTGEIKDVSPERAMTVPARHTWTVPLVFSQADPRALYFSNQFLFKTTSGGESWTQVSPDLTREDPGAPANLDAATAADAPEGKRRGVIYTIAPSPLRAQTIWVGTDDGLIHRTDDDGKTWQNVTPPELTAWSKVVLMDASHFDVNEAYAAIDRHRLEDYEPHIYRTRDGGKTWQQITNGLPPGVYMQTVKEDPQRRGLLFAGTELSVFVSFDDGDHWQPLQLNLPHASVRDLVIREDDLIVATHGRGFWVLDDITPLRQLSAEVVNAATYLFHPADAFNMPPPSENGTPKPRDEALAENPPYGALIDYYLKAGASGEVVLEILNPAGESIRRYSSAERPTPVDPNTLSIPAFWVRTPATLSAAAGMHRWVWDLRPTPPANRAAGGGGGGGGVFGGRNTAVLPGLYTVKLTVEGQSYTQPLRVKMDPRAR
ncbi:MAG: WD40/YVTN/BNR-like repeat-containing protein [Pyrinomonadaceae bacterium]